MSMLWMQETADGTLFKVAVQPRGSKNTIVGIQGDALKIKLTAPPVEGAANKMCIGFLAETLRVPKSAIEIVHGYGSRSKVVLVRSLARKQVEALLQAG
jgi:uncharacterized protein (TIGR00251 family)